MAGMGLDLWTPASPGDADWLAAVAGDAVLTWVEVLHPAYRLRPDGAPAEVRWAEVGVAHGGELRSGVHFDALVGLPQGRFENGLDEPGGVWDLPPAQGSLPRELGDRLGELLSAHTDAVTGSVGVWEGWAAAEPLRALGAPRIWAFGRELLLFTAPLAAMNCSVDTAGHQGANLWYPQDHRWILRTDPDHWSTFVGGDPDLGAQLLAATGIEVRRA